jgi:hypothetical protein
VRWLVVVLAGCGGAAAPPTEPLANHAPAQAVDPGGLEVRFERTACMGPCPTYRVTIHRDGRVDWHGAENVRVAGDMHGLIDRRALGRLEVALELAKFYERKDDGRLGENGVIMICTDVPSVVIEATAPGKHNKIDYTLGCAKDPALDQLVDQLDQIAGTAAWR